MLNNQIFLVIKIEKLTHYSAHTFYNSFNSITTLKMASNTEQFQIDTNMAQSQNMDYPSSLQHGFNTEQTRNMDYPPSSPYRLSAEQIQNSINFVSPDSSESSLIFDQLVVTASNNYELQQSICNIVSTLRTNVYEIIIKVLIVNGYNAETINFIEIAENLHNNFNTLFFEVVGHYRHNYIKHIMMKEINSLTICKRGIFNA